MANRVVDFPLEDLAGGEQAVLRDGIFASLVFAVVGDSQELISGTKPQKLGSASRRNSRDGMGWYSSSNSTDGVYYALPADHPLYSIGIEITIFQIAQIDSWAAYSSLLCVPYRNGSWADPYGAFGLQRDNTANTIRLWGYGGASTYISNTTSLTVTSGGRHAIGAARYANGCRFLINGQYDDSVAGVNRSSAFSWTNKQPLVILNRSNSNAGEGATGSAPVTLIFGRALTEPEMRWLADNWREAADIEDALAPLPTAVSIDIAGSVASAVAAGITGSAQVATEIAGAVGNATAAGITGSAQVAVEIAGSVGNAVAAGVAGAASVTNDISIDGVVGNAVAAGVAGDTSVGSDISISGTVGNAVAAGTAGVPGVSTTIAAAVGNATAAGVSGLAAIGVLIDGSVGNATAAGITGTLTLDIVVAGVVANAVAAGVTGSASVDAAAVSATPGYTIAAKARRLTITAAARRLEIRK